MQSPCSDDAARIIAGATKWALGAGMLIPGAGLDFLAVSGIQIWMIRRLAEHYDVPFIKNAGKSILASLMGGVPVAKGSILKLIPVFGQLLGAAAVAGLAAASTYAVGRVFQQHFESGGTFLTLDPLKARAQFKEEFSRGGTLHTDLAGETRSHDAATESRHTESGSRNI